MFYPQTKRKHCNKKPAMHYMYVYSIEQIIMEQLYEIEMTDIFLYMWKNEAEA